MNIAKLRKQLSDQKDAIQGLKYIFADDNELVELQNKMRKRKEQILLERKPKIEQLQKEIQSIENQIGEHEKKKAAKALVVPEKLLLWLKKYGAGVEGGYNWKIIWFDETERYAIVRISGGNYWSGRGMQSYGRTSFELIDTHKTERWTDMKQIHTIEGRFTIAARLEFENKLDEYKKRLIQLEKEG